MFKVRYNCSRYIILRYGFSRYGFSRYGFSRYTFSQLSIQLSFKLIKIVLQIVHNLKYNFVNLNESCIDKCEKV